MQKDIELTVESCGINYDVSTIISGTGRREVHAKPEGDKVWNLGMKRIGFINFDGKYWFPTSLSGMVMPRCRTIQEAAAILIGDVFQPMSAAA